MLDRIKLAGLWLAFLGSGAAVAAWAPEQAPAEIVFLSVGQGDCTVFRYEGVTVLVDVGPKSEDFDAGARIVAPKLRAMGVDIVDLIILTHPDVDHIGGLEGLASKIRTGKVIAPKHFESSQELRSALNAAGASDVLWIAADMQLSVQDLKLNIRVPKYKVGEAENEGSLFVKYELKGRSVVLPGDAGVETELQMLGREDWSADILKAGHHGSKGSSGEAWLKEVGAKAIVVSCGRGNRFGHPAPETLSRLQNANAKVYRTDLDGDVRFQMRPEGFVRLRR